MDLTYCFYSLINYSHLKVSSKVLVGFCLGCLFRNHNSLKLSFLAPILSYEFTLGIICASNQFWGGGNWSTEGSEQFGSFGYYIFAENASK